VLELLRADPALYVQKSVANVLRNASARHPDFVLTLCRERGCSTDPHTRWIIREGLRTLARVRPTAVDEILRAVSRIATLPASPTTCSFRRPWDDELTRVKERESWFFNSWLARDV
jgi:hypothetical protein